MASVPRVFLQKKGGGGWDTVGITHLAVCCFGELLARQSAPTPPDVVALADALLWVTVDIARPPDQALPEGASHVLVTNSSGLTWIADGFLRAQEGLRVVKLDASLGSVTHVGYAFLSDCPNLRWVDASASTNVDLVCDRFLQGCTSLTSLDVNDWTRLRVVGDYFLANCTTLPRLSVTAWSNVARVGHSFLYGCCQLVSVTVPEEHQQLSQFAK
jgi:hypothetical protein